MRDRESFEALYDDHATAVYDVAYGLLRDPVQAQDVVQDVFLRLWRRPGLFDPARGQIGALLRVMARTRAVDLWRQGETARRGRERMQREPRAIDSRPDERPATAAEDACERALLVQALHRLPAAQREALVLAYWGGLSIAQIARRSAVPVGTAKSRVRLGLTKLRADCDSMAG